MRRAKGLEMLEKITLDRPQDVESRLRLLQEIFITRAIAAAEAAKSNDKKVVEQDDEIARADQALCLDRGRPDQSD